MPHNTRKDTKQPKQGKMDSKRSVTFALSRKDSVKETQIFAGLVAGKIHTRVAHSEGGAKVQKFPALPLLNPLQGTVRRLLCSKLLMTLLQGVYNTFRRFITGNSGTSMQ